MFERRHEPLLPRVAFARRFAKFALMALAMVLASLGIGRKETGIGGNLRLAKDSNVIAVAHLYGAAA